MTGLPARIRGPTYPEDAWRLLTMPIRIQRDFLERLAELRQSVKRTWLYRKYRQSLLYDAVRRHGKTFKRAVKLHRYLGADHECPICGAGLSAFRPIGRSYWRDFERFGAIHAPTSMETFNVTAFTCPNCGASDRERLDLQRASYAAPSVVSVHRKSRSAS